MDMQVAADASGSEDEPWTLPEGWCWTEIGHVAPVNPSTTFDSLSGDSNVTFIPMAAVDEETGKIEVSLKRPISEVSKGYVRFQQGDVLFAKITPCMENGKVAPVPTLEGQYAAGSTEFHVLRPEAVDQRFLWYWVVSRRFRHEAQRKMSGSAGQLRVPASFLRESTIPLAPLPEQRRIVERIDALFAEIADGEAALEAARKGLETFRRALLKAAVSGELTRDWRETHTPAETGHDLLARIRAERAATPTKGRGKSAAATPPLDTSDLPDLPEGWVWARVGDIAQVGTGATPSRREPSYWENGNIPWFTSTATNAEFALTPSECITRRAVAETNCNILPVGTLLVAMYGEGKTRGQITELRVEAACNQACATLIVTNALIREWLKCWFKSFYAQLRTQAAGGVQPNLNLEIIKKLIIPLPPLGEAAEILKCVSDATELHADTFGVLKAQADAAARLRQAILKSAFEGTLVPQDPADEPAFVMLERLRQAAPKVNPKRRGRGKAGHGG